METTIDVVFDKSFAGFTVYPDDDPTEVMQGQPFTSMDA